MMFEELTIFKKRAAAIMDNFCKEWQHSFYNDKIYFDEYQIDFPGPNVYTWKVIAVNVSTLKKMAIVVTGHLGQIDSLQHVYTISVNVEGDRVLDFKKKDFNPVKLRDDFHTFCTSIFNYPEVDKQAYRLHLIFDEDANILSARTVFKFSGDFTDHFVYHVSDLAVLRGYGIDKKELVNYRNFKFLWEYTDIRNVMSEYVFFNALQLYIKDVDRYHSLLQMERI
jgi:hypothetical protein